MNDRNQIIQTFLSDQTWSKMVRSHLAGDASNRKYERLTDPETQASYVLMDSPGDPKNAVLPFIQITEYLETIGLSPPRVLKADTTNGLLIIEDLGDDLFAKFMQNHPSQTAALYKAATDVLLHLHQQAPPKDLQPYGPTEMAEVGCLALSWYAKGCELNASTSVISEFHACLESVISANWFGPSVLVQRDYHAENLLWLPDRSAPKNVGLLDYQDGRLGHVAYDLVSLLEDARRDVEPDIAKGMLQYYIEQSDHDDQKFRAAYAAMGAQRNLRILGVFARLSMHFGKPTYVDLIPRVWNYLQHDLSHPALSELREKCARYLPEPTPKNLEKLKEKCGTIPHL